MADPALSEPAAPPARTVGSWLWRRLPTALVLAALIGLGILGHHTGWTVPRLFRDDARPDDWCPAHGVPESQCVECQPDLLPRAKAHGFCRTHGVAECPLCNPDVAQLSTAPSVHREDLDRTARALAFVDRPENDANCKKHERRIQLVSQAAADKAGLQSRRAEIAPVVEGIAGSGEITYDRSRLARLSSRLPGTVYRVDKQVGDPVAKGEVLALVDAAEVGKAKADFLQAFAQVDLKSRTLESMRGAGEAVPARTVRETEAALREARIRLLSARQALVNLGLPVPIDDLKNLPEDKLAQQVQFLGLPEALAAALDPRTTSGSLLPVRAPIDGVVVSREIVPGEVVDSAKLLFVVADTRSMWLDLNVRLEDARHLQLGQMVQFRPDGIAPAALPWYTVAGQRLTWNQTLEGTIAWISTAVDDKTRAVKVRAQFANPDGNLRAGTFGNGLIVLRQENGVVVPPDAVHWEGCCHVVFVQDKNYRDGPKVYHVRKVVPGAKDEKRTEIVAGVLPGEVVATSGSGILRTMLLSSSLGDGCGCGH